MVSKCKTGNTSRIIINIIPRNNIVDNNCPQSPWNMIANNKLEKDFRKTMNTITNSLTIWNNNTINLSNNIPISMV